MTSDEGVASTLFVRIVFNLFLSNDLYHGLSIFDKGILHGLSIFGNAILHGLSIFKHLVSQCRKPSPVNSKRCRLANGERPLR